MMTCERCGREMADNLAICPFCGTTTSRARAAGQPPTQHGQYPPEVYSNPEAYGQGYQQYPQESERYGQGYPQQQYMNTPPMQQQYVPPQQNYGYGQPYNPNPGYQPGAVNINIVNNAPLNNPNVVVNTKNNAALIVEILLNLFLGIYGVGWLMAGETVPGIVLLICTPVYWFLAIMFIVFTFGLGACIFFPFAIGAIILNAVLLNNTLNRKVTQYVFVQPK
jgi:hypothetical protein